MPRSIPTAKMMRQLAWNISHKLSFREFPLPLQQRHLFPILRALIAHLVTRLVARGLIRTLNNLLRQLWGLLDINYLLLLILQYYPELLTDKITEEITSKGLGKRGFFSIPEHIWHKHVSAELVGAIKHFKPPRFHRPLSHDTKQLLHALQRDGFLLPSTTPSRDTLTAFLRPKSIEKACFIADLREINKLTPRPLPKFSLPSLECLTKVIQMFPPGTLWATTLDLTNFYWSIRLPAQAHKWFCINNLCYDSLPFGWNLSPVIAQETLGFILDKAFIVLGCLPFYNRSLFAFRYLDDILLLSNSKYFLTTFTTQLSQYLSSVGLIVSPKSCLTPSYYITWLGKHVDLVDRSITPTAPATLRLFAIVLLFPLLPLHKKLLQRIAGVLLWSGRPLVGTTIFLQPLYNRIFPPSALPKPRFLGYAANTACKCLLDLAACASIGWQASPHVAPPILLPEYSLFVDAAYHNPIYMTGIFPRNMAFKYMQPQK